MTFLFRVLLHDPLRRFVHKCFVQFFHFFKGCVIDLLQIIRVVCNTIFPIDNNLKIHAEFVVCRKIYVLYLLHRLLWALNNLRTIHFFLLLLSPTFLSFVEYLFLNLLFFFGSAICSWGDQKTAYLASMRIGMLYSHINLRRLTSKLHHVWIILIWYGYTEAAFAIHSLAECLADTRISLIISNMTIKTFIDIRDIKILSKQIFLALYFILEMGEIFDCKELFDIVINASLDHLLVHSITFRNSWYNIMDEMVKALLICHGCFVVFVHVPICACEDVVSREATRVFHDDIPVAIVKRLKNTVILFKLVDAILKLTIIKSAPHIFLDFSRYLLLKVWTFVTTITSGKQIRHIQIIFLLVTSIIESQTHPQLLITESLCKLNW